MSKFLKKLKDVLRSPYAPNPHRRKEVVHNLAQRDSLTNEEWHHQFAEPLGIPLSFVAWYRDTCSEYFGYDLSAALPNDKLIDDLGLFEATWGDSDWDILEDYEAQFKCKRPLLEDATTFGQFLEQLWVNAQKNTNA